MTALRPIRRRREILWLLGIIAVTIVTGVGGLILREIFGLQVPEELLLSCLVIGVSSVLGILALWVLEQERYRKLAIAACTLAACMAVCFLFVIWTQNSRAIITNERMSTLFGALEIAAVSMLCTAAILNVRFRVWWWHAVPIAAVALLAVPAAIAMLGLTMERFMQSMFDQFGNDAFPFTMIGFLLTGGACVLALPLMKIVERIPAREADTALASSRVGVTVGCPRCATQAQIRANEACRCPVCNLEMRIELQEPRCACGYLIHKLSAPVCPECGALVPPELNWLPQPVGAPTHPQSP